MSSWIDGEANSEADAGQVVRLLSRSEYLAAFDAAEHALAVTPDHPGLQHLAILALARAGATDTTDDRLRRSGLIQRAGDMDVALAEDVLALEFETTSVIGAGEAWLERHRRCLERATSVTVVTGGRQGDDDAAYSYCSSMAMGGALVRAQFMASRAEQLAVWDGRSTNRSAGTAADIQRWRATGRPATVVPVTSPPAPTASAGVMDPARPERAVRALLFADAVGCARRCVGAVPQRLGRCALRGVRRRFCGCRGGVVAAGHHDAHRPSHPRSADHDGPADRVARRPRVRHVRPGARRAVVLR